VLVVEVAGLLIAEDLVGLRDGFEFLVGFFALLVGDFVGVGCESGLGRWVSLTVVVAILRVWYLLCGMLF
jgi:hypothetical protein